MKLRKASSETDASSTACAALILRNGQLVREDKCFCTKDKQWKPARARFESQTLELVHWHPICCQQLGMILNAEALEIIAYLKTAPNKFVSILEISRRAGGRRRFEESPNWAKNLVSPLVEAGLLEVNARGHYRAIVAAESENKPKEQSASATPPSRKLRATVVGDDYFPSSLATIVGGDYFPSSD